MYSRLGNIPSKDIAEGVHKDCPIATPDTYSLIVNEHLTSNDNHKSPSTDCNSNNFDTIHIHQKSQNSSTKLKKPAHVHFSETPVTCANGFTKSKLKGSNVIVNGCNEDIISSDYLYKTPDIPRDKRENCNNHNNTQPRISNNQKPTDNEKMSTWSLSSTQFFFINPYNVRNYRFCRKLKLQGWIIYLLVCFYPGVKYMESSDYLYMNGRNELSKQYARRSTILFVVGALLLVILVSLFLFFIVYFC